jgi:hypothetical protein
MQSVPAALNGEFLSCAALAALLGVNSEHLRQWLKPLLLDFDGHVGEENPQCRKPRVKFLVSAAVAIVQQHEQRHEARRRRVGDSA